MCSRPSSQRWRSGNSRLRSRPSITRFSRITSACRRPMPLSRAASISCRVSPSPSPLPWNLSSTSAAYSGPSVPASRSQRTTATISPSSSGSSATSAKRSTPSTSAKLRALSSESSFTGPKNRSSIERSLDRSTSRRKAPASSARTSRTGTDTPSLSVRSPLTVTPTSILLRYVRSAHKIIVPQSGRVETPVLDFPVKTLTAWRFGPALLRGFRLDHLQELAFLDFEVFCEQFGGKAVGHGFSEGFAVLLQELEGSTVVLFEGAGPLLVGFFDGLVESLALQDQGRELDGFVCGSRHAALGGGDEPDGGVEADHVSEEVCHVPGFLARDPQFRSVGFASGLCHGLLRLLFGALGLAAALRRAGGEGAVAGYGLADYQGVHVVGPLVGVDTLDVGHVLHHSVVEEDAIAPEHVARRGGDLARLGYVVHLEHRDGRRIELAGVLEASDVDGE